MITTFSPSRTYVVMVIKLGYLGHIFYKFVLPDNLINDSNSALHYYLTNLDQTFTIEGCFAFEELFDIRDVAVEIKDISYVKDFENFEKISPNGITTEQMEAFNLRETLKDELNKLREQQKI